MPEGPSLYHYAKKIIFPRPVPSTYTTATHPNELLHIPCVAEQTAEPTGDFTVGYLLRSVGATHLLIYAHPNSVDMGMVYHDLKFVGQKANVDVLLFEYTGYGLAKGEITPDTVNTDMASAYYFARRYLHVPANRMIIGGRSIGAAPAARLCSLLCGPDAPTLLVMQCPFTTLSECIHSFAVEGAASVANYLGYNWFRTIDLIADVECPVALHHGTIDRIVPIAHSYALREKRISAAQPRVTFVYSEEGKGHNNLSKSRLISILQDVVETEGLPPLQTRWPSCFVAHMPLYPHLFVKDGATLHATAALWKERYSLEPIVRSRDTYYTILTASVCIFTMKIAHFWQLYSDVYRHHSKSAEGVERIPKREFIARCTAVYGSPLGIHLAVPASPNERMAAIVFGSNVLAERWGDFDTGWDFDSDLHEQDPCLTVMELTPTEHLIQLIGQGIATAPDLLDSGDVRCFLHPDIVSSIQQECERIVASISDELSATLADLFASFPSCHSILMSRKTCSVLSTCRSFAEESFADLWEWLRPYSTAQDQLSLFKHEVPWDYYLFKGRALAKRHRWTRDIDWTESSAMMNEMKLVSDIYAFFRDYHLPLSTNALLIR